MGPLFKPSALNTNGNPCLLGISNLSGTISKLSGSSSTFSSSLSLFLVPGILLLSYFFFSTFFFFAQLTIWLLLPKFSINIVFVYSLCVKTTPNWILFKSSPQNIVNSVPFAFNVTSTSTPSLITK